MGHLLTFFNSTISKNARFNEATTRGTKEARGHCKRSGVIAKIRHNSCSTWRQNLRNFLFILRFPRRNRPFPASPAMICPDFVVVVLPNPFRGMGAWRNSTETQQSDHAPRSGPEVKNGRSCAKDGAPERIGCGTIQEESQILQKVSAGAAWRILPFYPAYVRGQEKAVTVAAKLGQFTADETGKGQFLRGTAEGVVRKISSPQRLASVSNLENGRSQWAGLSRLRCHSYSLILLRILICFLSQDKTEEIFLHRLRSSTAGSKSPLSGLSPSGRSPRHFGHLLLPSLISGTDLGAWHDCWISAKFIRTPPLQSRILP